MIFHSLFSPPTGLRRGLFSYTEVIPDFQELVHLQVFRVIVILLPKNRGKIRVSTAEPLTVLVSIIAVRIA